MASDTVVDSSSGSVGERVEDSIADTVAGQVEGGEVVVVEDRQVEEGEIVVGELLGERATGQQH